VPCNLQPYGFTPNQPAFFQTAYSPIQTLKNDEHLILYHISATLCDEAFKLHTIKCKRKPAGIELSGPKEGERLPTERHCLHLELCLLAKGK
jgi:hypothetical protein